MKGLEVSTLSELLSVVLSYLANSLWQVPLIFAAGWTAAQGAKRLSAELEHRVWVGALLLEVLLPACFGVPSGWWKSLFYWGLDPRGSNGAHVSVVMGAGTGVGSIGLPDWFLVVAAIAYGAVVSYFSARFVWRLNKLRGIRSGAVELILPSESDEYWHECRSRFGVGQVSLASFQKIRGPVALGVRRKLVLLPTGMLESLPSEDLNTVIAHELAHIQRQDFLKNLLYEVISLLVSYHPVAWMTQQRVKESREIVCDQMAAGIAGTGAEGRSKYARSLLRLASLVLKGSQNGQFGGIAIGIFDADVFERRVMRLTEKQDEVCGVRRWAVMVGCAALAVVCCGSALALSMRVDAGAIGSAVSSTTIGQNGPGGDSSAGSGAPARKAKKVMVSSGVMTGLRLSGSNPIYPVDAKKAKIQGTVVLSAVISKEGEVENLKVVSGPKELQQSSLDAVRDWKYRPYLLNGDAVEVETTINVIYSLAG